ncbi:MAG: hypothetical protein KF721_15815, partial [Ignavibacteriaceae bacterium]|nr:hypothetical protein [Ignavibacteriaceae bacterium]
YSKEKLIKLSNSLPQEITSHSSAVKRIQCMVSHNTILSAKELLDFTSISFLFFCSFTDKILNSYTYS